ncbi:MAG: aminopeptidase P N-terminal domain-containing protein, partial [Anaeroplasmataceae bacterium]|nr:aminopeptidase P N-terminal domain-containing protein [Anaeroplasmataceae bacterium]
MNQKVFIEHRNTLLDLMMDQSVLVVFSNPKVDVKKDVDRNYYYLTGNFEYENKIVLVKNGSSCQEMIFINPYDEFKAKWVGAPLSKEAITLQSGIKNVYYLDELDQMMNQLLNDNTKLY